MTKAQLYTFVTSLLDGLEMDTVLFSNFLNISQMRRENMRPWMILRSEDSSQTVSSGNTFLTEKSLPTDFRRWYSRSPVVIIDSANNPMAYLKEVPIGQKYTHKGNGSKFYTNYATNKLFICGDWSQSGTIIQNYIKKSTLVSADGENEWIFPSEYHEILGLDVAVMQKLGVDYDIINNAQGNNQATLANTIFMQMAEWDDELQNSSVQGVDYGSGGSYSGELSGRIG